jgi:hypothetical protein
LSQKKKGSYYETVKLKSKMKQLVYKEKKSLSGLNSGLVHSVFFIVGIQWQFY